MRGSVTTDMIAVVEQQLPLRAFLFYDEQSDKEAFERMNAKFLSSKVEPAWLPHLLLDRGFALLRNSGRRERCSARSRMYHALVAYYMLLLGMHNGR